MHFLQALHASAHSDHCTYIWQRGYYKGGGRGGVGGSNDGILSRVCMFYTRLFAFYMRKRIQRCLFNWIRPLVGVTLQKKRRDPTHPPAGLQGKYALHLNWCVTLSSSPHYHSHRVIWAILLAIMMHDILSHFNQELWDPAARYQSRHRLPSAVHSSHTKSSTSQPFSPPPPTALRHFPCIIRQSPQRIAEMFSFLFPFFN